VKINHSVDGGAPVSIGLRTVTCGSSWVENVTNYAKASHGFQSPVFRTVEQVDFESLAETPAKYICSQQERLGIS